MCGIIGIIGNSKVTDRIVDSLKKLEYRGYDSAGIAVIDNNKIAVTKVAGKIASLELELKHSMINGNSGIGHTRWATHGAPERRNAHPFQAGDIALVHNGIIENYKEIKDRLISEGYSFESDTDTEVLLKLIHSYYLAGLNEYDSVFKAFHEVKGAFAVAILFANNVNLMIGMRQGAPLAIGIGNGEMYLGSDALALSSLTNKLIYLDDGDIVELSCENYQITNSLGEKVDRVFKEVNLDLISSSKKGLQHYMLKEIYEQPQVAATIFNEYYDRFAKKFRFDRVGLNLKDCSRIYMIACGTSYHATLVAKYWFEKFTKIPVDVDIASEFRYRNFTLDKNGVGIFISQSGETADTLAALRYLKESGLRVIAIVNVEESSIAREADYVLPIYAGYEIGVASTKAFTAQLLIMAMLCFHTSYEKKLLTLSQLNDHLSLLHTLPDTINEVLTLEDEIKVIAQTLKNVSNMLYIGRGTSYALALEGALKIKEISYIHAEGVAAGELKHGSIALIDEKLPVIVIAPSNSVFSKITSNIQEINARKAIIITLTDSLGAKELTSISTKVIKAPDCDEITSAIVFNIPLQLLAYHTALALGRDVDQPRNLAKSVTVE